MIPANNEGLVPGGLAVIVSSSTEKTSSNIGKVVELVRNVTTGGFIPEIEDVCSGKLSEEFGGQCWLVKGRDLKLKLTNDTAVSHHYSILLSHRLMPLKGDFKEAQNTTKILDKIAV